MPEGNPVTEYDVKVYLDGNEEQIVPSQIPFYYTNSDVQYKVNLLSFQSLFNQLYQHVYPSRARDESVILTDSPKAIMFVNNGLVVQFLISENTMIEYLAEVVFS